MSDRPDLPADLFGPTATVKDWEVTAAPKPA
jgi:hypothetical protein